MGSSFSAWPGCSGFLFSAQIPVLYVIFWKEKSLVLCSLQRWILTRRSWMLYGLILGNSSSTAMGFHCFAVVGQMLSCLLLDYNSCNCNNTEKVVVLELCVLLWFRGFFCGFLKNSLCTSVLFHPSSVSLCPCAEHAATELGTQNRRWE